MYLPFGSFRDARCQKLFPALYIFYYSCTVPHRMMFGPVLSFSFNVFILDDSNPTAFLSTSDSDISRDFLMQITSSTGFKNCEATNTSICKIVCSAVLLTFIAILTSNIFFSKAFINVAVPILVRVSNFSWNSIFSKGSTTVISSFFQLNGVIITSYPSNLYWLKPFADYIVFFYNSWICTNYQLFTQSLATYFIRIQFLQFITHKINVIAAGPASNQFFPSFELSLSEFLTNFLMQALFYQTNLRVSQNFLALPWQSWFSL